MNAPALLDDLLAAGIRLRLECDGLMADVLPGADLDPYRVQIAEHKPALLAALRERDAIASLVAQLDQGWEWLERHPTHAEHASFLDRWIGRLRAYEAAHRHHHQSGEE